MSRFSDFGNDLYSGRRSFGFVPRRGLWLAIAGALVVISLLIPVVKGGFNLGIDFTGGSEFTVSGVENPDASVGERAVADTAGTQEATVTNIAPGTVRVQTQQLDDDQTLAVRDALEAVARNEGVDVATALVDSPVTAASPYAAAAVAMVRFFIVLLFPGVGRSRGADHAVSTFRLFLLV